MYCPARNCRRSFAGSFSFQHHHVGSDPVHLLHPARQLADLQLAHPADFARLDHQIGQRPGLAEQRQPRFLLELGEHVRLRIAVVHLAL